MIDPLFSIFVMVITVTLLFFYFFTKKTEEKDWIYVFYFIFILLIGIFLHYAAYTQNLVGQNEVSVSKLLAFGKALETSLKSFGGGFNIEVTQGEQIDDYYKVAVFIHYIASMLLTFLITIKIFGKNIGNLVRIFKNSRRPKYIVIGSGKQAKLFLSSLDYKKKKRTTVILEAEQREKRKSLIFKGFAVITIKEQIDKTTAKLVDETDLVFEALKRAGFQKNKHDTKVIALSERDELNLLVAKLVTDHIAAIIQPTRSKQGRINKLSQKQEDKLKRLHLSAHIMYHTLDRAEHFSFAEYSLGRVRFFNLYEIRARKFMLKNPITSLIPKTWINPNKARLYNATDPDCSKSYRIGNIFIGYGMTNRHLLKNSICNYQLLGTDYNALIIDKNAATFEKQFQNSAPGLFDTVTNHGIVVYGTELDPNPDGATYYPNPDEGYNLSFASFDVMHSEFYERIVREITGCNDNCGLDYVSLFIALGNDKLSVETALELRQKLYERKLLNGRDGEKEYSRVRIFVKIKEKSLLSSFEFLNDINCNECEIMIFGLADNVLSEKYIIHEELDLIAKRIANSYWENADYQGKETNPVSRWDTLTEFKRNSNRYAAMSIQTKLNLLGFDLVDDGKTTEPEIIAAYEQSYGIEQAQYLRRKKKQQSKKFVELIERNEDGTIIDNARNNLTRLEHQRWNALHLVNGWTKLAIADVAASTRQDEQSKQHACITTLEGLIALRERQAKDRVKNSKEDISIDEALIAADTIGYDSDVMDMLLEILSNSRYRITKAED